MCFPRYHLEKKGTSRDSKQNILEHQNKKIVLTELMLEMYYKRLEQLVTYNRQKQLEYAQAQQGKFLDIEV